MKLLLFHPTNIRTARSLWTWLWGRYHVPQNVFLVTHGPHLSALEIRLGIIKRYTHGSFTYLLTSHTQPVFQNDLAEFVVTWAHSFNLLVGFSFQRVLSYHNIRLHWLSQLSNAREMSISVRDQFIVEETKRATTALLIGMYSVTKNRCSISKFLNITPEPSWLGVWNRHPVSNVTYYLLHFYVFIVPGM